MEQKREEVFQKASKECVLRGVRSHQSHRARGRLDVERVDLPLRRVTAQEGVEVAVRKLVNHDRMVLAAP